MRTRQRSLVDEIVMRRMINAVMPGCRLSSAESQTTVSVVADIDNVSEPGWPSSITFTHIRASGKWNINFSFHGIYSSISDDNFNAVYERAMNMLSVKANKEFAEDLQFFKAYLRHGPCNQKTSSTNNELMIQTFRRQALSFRALSRIVDARVPLLLTTEAP